MDVPTSAVEYYLIETTNIMYEKFFTCVWLLIFDRNAEFNDLI